MPTRFCTVLHGPLARVGTVLGLLRLQVRACGLLGVLRLQFRVCAFLGAHCYMFGRSNCTNSFTTGTICQQQAGGRDPLAEMSKSGSRSLHPFQCGWSRRQIEGVQENCPEVVAVGKRFGEVQFCQVGCKVWVRQNYAHLSSSRRNSPMLRLWNRQAWPIRK